MKQNGKIIHTYVENTVQTLRELGQYSSRTNDRCRSLNKMDIILFSWYLIFNNVIQKRTKFTRLSYFSGRINNSTLLSELIYSMSNFMMLFNDQIILSTAKSSVSINDVEKKKMFCSENIKRFLTMVDYIEVFIEVSANRLWGTRGRWVIIVLLQSVK